MKLKYMCWDSTLDLWPRGHSEHGLSLLGSGVHGSEMEYAALGSVSVVNADCRLHTADNGKNAD